MTFIEKIVYFYDSTVSLQSSTPNFDQNLEAKLKLDILSSTFDTTLVVQKIQQQSLAHPNQPIQEILLDQPHHAWCWKYH